MTGAVVAQINLAALRHNLDRVKAIAPDSRVMAVIKANGYGHGMIQVANTLSGADAFAVARLEEAIILRQAGIDTPIAVLEGFTSAAELIAHIEYGLQAVAHQNFHIEMLEQAKSGANLDVWLKLDTGMHRMGVTPEQAEECCSRLEAAASVKEVRLMTHFACADDRRSDQTLAQMACFFQATKGHFNEVSMANSAAVLGWPQSHADWVRPGLMLFGVSPFVGGWGEDYQLKPVMNLSSRLIAVNHFKQGDAIGYGASWCCPEDMPVGIIACGYGDGYPRHAEAGTSVLVNEQRVSLIGRVSMDSLCVDLRDLPNAAVGDPVLLWGDKLPVEDVARTSTTIPYELLCSVTGRVDFQYIPAE